MDKALGGGLAIGYAYFGICAAIAVFGALCTVLAKNPIRGAMGLLLMIVSLAGLFLSLHAEFLATIQLIVYAGAIVVLFLFVIMLLGPSATIPPDTRGRLPRLVSAGLFIATSVGLAAAVVTQSLKDNGLPSATSAVVPKGFGGIRPFGEQLFDKALVPFELASLLLMVAVVGAVAVARGKQPDQPGAPHGGAQ